VKDAARIAGAGNGAKVASEAGDVVSLDFRSVLTVASDQSTSELSSASGAT